MNITEALKKTPSSQKEKALSALLEGALTPALGALPKREMELLLLDALITVGYLDKDPKVYDMVQRLKITKGRARTLLYDLELRRQNETSLDEMVVAALKKPLLQGQGYAIALEIENPYLADHIRNRITELGHVSDGSFSPSLIRLSASAAAALVDHYLDRVEKKKVERALIRVGGEDRSVTGLMTKVIAGAANAVAGKAGEAAITQGAELMGALLDANADKIVSYVDGIVSFIKTNNQRV